MKREISRKPFRNYILFKRIIKFPASVNKKRIEKKRLPVYNLLDD